MMRLFMRHLELWLSAAGVAVILLVPSLFGASRENYWYATAVTAIAVGLLHGLIFWSVRRRQRLVRDRTIAHLRAMLRDDIHKQVAALLTVDARATKEQHTQLDGVFDSLALLDHILGSISAERLSTWTGTEEGAVELRKPHRKDPSYPELNVFRSSQN